MLAMTLKSDKQMIKKWRLQHRERDSRGILSNSYRIFEILFLRKLKKLRPGNPD